MNRKRFVKKLMGHGLDRNTAQFAAGLVGGRHGQSYSEIYGKIDHIAESCSMPMERVVTAMYLPADCFVPLWNTLCEFISNVAAAMSSVFGALSEATANASASFQGMRIQTDTTRDDSVDALAYALQCLTEGKG